MFVPETTHVAQPWPRPPRCLVATDLTLPPNGARVAVAGLVVCRQRPGTAKGVIFVTLEDETGTANVIVWASAFERFRRAVIAGRCLKVTGRLQRDGDVTHVVAEQIEDISALLDRDRRGLGAARPRRMAARRGRNVAQGSAAGVWLKRLRAGNRRDFHRAHGPPSKTARP